MINFWENVDLQAKLERFQGDGFRIVGKLGDHSVTLKKPDDKDRGIEEVKKVFDDISMYLSNEKGLDGMVKGILLNFKENIQLKIQEALEKGPLQEEEVPLELLPAWLAKVSKESKDMSEIESKYMNQPYLLFDCVQQSFDEKNDLYEEIETSAPKGPKFQKRLDDLLAQRETFLQKVSSELDKMKTEKLLFEKLSKLRCESSFLKILQKIEDGKVISNDNLEKFIYSLDLRNINLVLSTFSEASSVCEHPDLRKRLNEVTQGLCTCAILCYFKDYVSDEKNDIDTVEKQIKDSKNLHFVLDVFNKRLGSVKTMAELKTLKENVTEFKEKVSFEAFQGFLGKDLSEISDMETIVSKQFEDEEKGLGVEELVKKAPVVQIKDKDLDMLIQDKDEMGLHSILDTIIDSRIALIETIRKKYIEEQPEGKAKECAERKIAELVHESRTILSKCQGKFDGNFDFYLLQKEYKLRLFEKDVSISRADEKVIRDSFLEAAKLPIPPINELEDEGFLLKIDLDPDDKVYSRADLHGDLEALLNKLETLKKQGMLDENYCCKKGVRLVFLGDYADRGDYGLQVLHLLVKLRTLNPNNVYLIRGNHESEEMLNAYGDERLKKFAMKKENLDALRGVIKTMPLSLYLRKKDTKGIGQYARFVHGGIDIRDDPKRILESTKTVDTMVVTKTKSLCDRISIMSIADVVATQKNKDRVDELRKERNELLEFFSLKRRKSELLQELVEIRNEMERFGSLESLKKNEGELVQKLKDNHEKIKKFGSLKFSTEEQLIQKLDKIHSEMEGFEFVGEEEIVRQSVAAERIQHLWAWISIHKVYHPDMPEASFYLWSDIGAELKFGERGNAVITITPEFLHAYQTLTSKDELLISGHKHFYQTHKAFPVWSKNKSDQTPRLCGMTLPVSREIQIEGEKGVWPKPEPTYEHVDYDFIIDLKPDIASSTIQEIKTDKDGTTIAAPKAVVDF